MVVWYNGHYVRLSIGKSGFNSPHDRHGLEDDQNRARDGIKITLDKESCAVYLKTHLHTGD